MTKRFFLTLNSLRLDCARFVIAIALGSASSMLFAGEPVPDTLEQAFHQLDKQLPSAERESFKKLPEREAVSQAHMGLGMYIRNAWFRTGKSALPGALEVQHLDDASSIVLTSYWRYLNGKPLGVEEQITCYRRWWVEQQRLEETAKSSGSTTYATPSFSCP